MTFDLGLRSKRLKWAGWKFIEPFFNVQQVFAFDLSMAEQLFSSSRHLPPDVAVKIFLRPSQSELEQIFVLLAQASARRRIVEKRLERGDMLALAIGNGAIAAYTWTTFSRAWIAEARRYLDLCDDQACSSIPL